MPQIELYPAIVCIFTQIDVKIFAAPPQGLLDIDLDTSDAKLMVFQTSKHTYSMFISGGSDNTSKTLLTSCSTENWTMQKSQEASWAQISGLYVCVHSHVSPGHLGVGYFFFLLLLVQSQIYKHKHDGAVLICGRPVGVLKGIKQGTGCLCGLKGCAFPGMTCFRASSMPVG
ncbi:hypothetical protein H4582DRAFT_2051937 [Lactarius indigo]|nr:hypothetical protein H4582DRAFT_2051937 [Lactarius indigo]